MDKEGTRVKLGQKTITGDNANAVKPFGTIDTPAQGQEISGTGYDNFGWALTPQPNMIPTDGSTIWIFVDGAPLAKSSYNHCRADIATLFPGLNNTNGAVGVTTLNTTAFSNGVHTIAWGVTDNAGNSEGLGSRYFSVLNLLGAKIDDPDLAADPYDASGHPGNPNRRAILDRSALDGIALNMTSPVYVTKGYDTNVRPEIRYPDLSGVVNIVIEDVERVELLFGHEAMERAEWSGRWSGRGADSHPHASSDAQPGESTDRGFGAAALSGYLVVGDELRPLPIGSTLDPASGVFAWQLGPGFLGEYVFVFVREYDGGHRDKTLVRITIVPKF